MNYYIGVDLGTSSLKSLLMDAQGKIIKQFSVGYDVLYPQSGWTEQNPSDWIAALKKAAKTVAVGYENNIKGISFGGQMHGLVVLDDNDNVIRPCILWNDGRTEKQTKYLNEKIGKNVLSELTGNIAFAGFTAPKLLWLYENERNNFQKISKLMLPKDYLVYYLCGAYCTDFSDASGTLLLDVKNKRWSKTMLDICHLKEEQMPTLCESFQAVGCLKEQVSQELGLPKCVKVIVGAGDNAAAAIGTNTVANGSCNISLGTSGTLFIAQDCFGVDDNNALHSFVHATGKWHLMGCILSAASCRKWWLENVLRSDDYENDQQLCADVDTEDILFLPYLSGERSPHNDVNAKGAFVGLTASTTRAQMSKAVMEGVAFAIRDCLEVAKLNGLCPKNVKLCGGGAKSVVWQQIFADVLNLPINIPKTEQGPGYGAAILAMVGCGEYETVQQAAEKITAVKNTVFPISANAQKYERKYLKYKKLYPLLRQLQD